MVEYYAILGKHLAETGQLAANLWQHHTLEDGLDELRASAMEMS